MSKSARFRLTLKIWHPTIRGEQISAGIGLLPRNSHTVGDKKVTPKGDVLVGFRVETFWSHEVVAEESFQDQVLQLCNYLSDRSEFILGLVDSGGRLELFVGWFMGKDSVIYIHHEVSSVLAKLSIDVAFDVYFDDGVG